MVYQKKVPLKRVRRAAVYENKGRLSLSQIVAEQQPDIALTGVFYNSKWKPVCPVKADGRVLYADKQYNYWALAWDKGSDAEPELIFPGGESEHANYIANCVLITGGKPHETLYYNADVGGVRGRTAVGLTEAGEWILYAAADGSEGACTPEQLRDALAAQGCTFAVMLDGGRKVNYYHRADGVLLEGKDPSQTLLLLWLEEAKEDAVGDVKTYSVKKDGATRLSENFRVREFACQDGSDEVQVSEKLVALLQQIRDRFGKAVTVTSAYRTAAYNKKVGGAANSQHLYGKAADIAVADTAPEAVAQYAECLQPDAGGIGLYGGFVHVDVREKRTRWNSRSGTAQAVDGFFGGEEAAALAWAKASGWLPDGWSADEPMTLEKLAVILYRQAKQNGTA